MSYMPAREQKIMSGENDFKSQKLFQIYPSEEIFNAASLTSSLI